MPNLTKVKRERMIENLKGYFELFEMEGGYSTHSDPKVRVLYMLVELILDTELKNE